MVTKDRACYGPVYSIKVNNRLMRKNTNTKVSGWIKWGGLCVMLIAGILVAQENSGQSANSVDSQEPAVEQPADGANESENLTEVPAKQSSSETQVFTMDRYEALMAGIAVFVVSVFVGFEVITKVPQTLHTPLMSGSNAISGITIVGAILVVANCVKTDDKFALFLAGLAIALAMVNVVGGFGVTHRMLSMFSSKKKNKSA